MKHVVGLLLCLVLSVPPASRAAAPATKPTDLGERVAAFCERHIGEQVDNGECARLALLALEAAGAKKRGKDNPNPGDYVWGQQIFLIEAPTDGQPPKTQGNFANVRRGDIIQFRDARLVRRVPGGRVTNTMTQHTAVIASIDADGDTLHTLEQNVSGNRTVQECAYKLSGLRAGWLRFYRPLPLDKK
jgi:hypothetical protein